MDKVRFWMEGIVMAVIALVGIPGNLLFMYILLRTKLDLHPFLRRLLIFLVASDSIFLVTDFLLNSLPLLNDHYYYFVKPVIAPKFLIPVGQISLTGSVYCIVAITVERFVRMFCQNTKHA